MNFLGEFKIDRPTPGQLRIERQPGIGFWLFMLLYLGIVTTINAVILKTFFDARSPVTLTCRSQRQTVNCEYVTPGLFTGRTLSIQNVRSAIASQQPSGLKTIVLTSSNPWIVLQGAESNAQNIDRINRGLAQLRQRDQTWQLQIAPPSGVAESFLVFFGSIGLLFLLLGIAAAWENSPAVFTFDADRNLITVTRWAYWRSRLAPFDQLLEAERKPFGYLGALSDRFGIYGGESIDRSEGLEIVRLLLADRRPITLSQTYYRSQAAPIINSINEFIGEQRRI